MLSHTNTFYGLSCTALLKGLIMSRQSGIIFSHESWRKKKTDLHTSNIWHFTAFQDALHSSRVSLAWMGWGGVNTQWRIFIIQRSSLGGFVCMVECKIEQEHFLLERAERCSSIVVMQMFNSFLMQNTVVSMWSQIWTPSFKVARNVVFLWNVALSIRNWSFTGFTSFKSYF